MSDKRRDIEPITLEEALQTIGSLCHFIIKITESNDKARRELVEALRSCGCDGKDAIISRYDY